jgi:hypothetical protein
MPAAVLPSARFASASPACSRSVLMPADAASAASWDGAVDAIAAAWPALDLQALAAHACGGVGLPAGVPDPDAKAAAGTATGMDGTIALPAGLTTQDLLVRQLTSGTALQGTALPGSFVHVLGGTDLLLLAMAGLTIAVAGARGPASWAARTRTSAVLHTE